MQCLPSQSKEEENDDLRYASIRFSKNQTDSLYSSRHKEEEDESTEYVAVKFNSRQIYHLIFNFITVAFAWCEFTCFLLSANLYHFVSSMQNFLIIFSLWKPEVRSQPGRIQLDFTAQSTKPAEDKWNHQPGVCIKQFVCWINHTFLSTVFLILAHVRQ